MALTYGFYNSLNGDRRYNAMQLSELIDGLITDGIFPEVGDEFQVQATSGLEISIGSGKAWFNKTWTLNDTAFLISLPEAEPLTSRVDAVILEVDTSEGVRANSIKVISGEPGMSSPNRPNLTKGLTKNQYALCYILRSPNNNQVTNADITNVVGDNETPFVKSLMAATGKVEDSEKLNGQPASYYAKNSHSHAVNDITSGTLPVDRGGTGGITASLARSSLGAAALSHTHAASDVTAGTLSVSRGGTGGTSALSARTSLGAEAILATDQKRKITISTANPSGGTNGDIWIKI